MYACAICPQIQPESWPAGLRELEPADVRITDRGLVHTANLRGLTAEHAIRQYADVDPDVIAGAFELAAL